LPWYFWSRESTRLANFAWLADSALDRAKPCTADLLVAPASRIGRGKRLPLIDAANFWHGCFASGRGKRKGVVLERRVECFWMQ
jgi:hypothetical protein